MQRSMILLALAAACGGEATREPVSTTRITQAVVAAPNSGEMRGLFHHHGDAISFEDCTSGKRVPVARERAYMSLERKFRETRSSRDAGSPMHVVVVGRIEPRPQPDSSDKVDTLVVDRTVAALTPSAACAAPPRAPLALYRWVAVEVDGQRLTPPVGSGPAPSLSFDAETGELSGFTGCNAVHGRWSVRSADPTMHQGRLVLAGVSSTRRACLGNVEPPVLDALTQAERFEIHGDELVLFDERGARARFKAAP
jgi:heat shock protein HslJ